MTSPTDPAATPQSRSSDGRLRVAVVFGGTSGEHPVSCLSAASVTSQLDPDLFDVIAVGITPLGAWRQVDPASLVPIDGAPLPQVGGSSEIALLPDATSQGLVAVGERAGAAGSDLTGIKVDVVFPVLHGPMGEDGTIQGLLELAGIPYVGAGVLASATGMDKEFTRKLLVAEGLQVCDWVVLRPGVATLTQQQKDDLGLPVFVKPARAGSSLGVSKVDDWADLDAAIALARRADPKVLVEAAVVGREIECGVLERPDGSVVASPTAEIHVAGEHAFYDFEAKYLDDASTFDIPAQLPPGVEDQVREQAVRAFRALDCQGLARVDFFVSDDGRILVNEINTMPGFTSISMYPRMFAAGGVDYPTLLTTLVRTAVARGTGLR